MAAKSVHFSSIIKLKEEYIERYVILHKHTFPEVLRRIAMSNIKNYSIFLNQNLLYSHFEYSGEDYKKDIDLIADDITQEWWKLTDPMQDPIKTRNENEWWASTEILFAYEGNLMSTIDVQRHVYKCSINCSIDSLKNAFAEGASIDLNEINSLLISHKDNEIYIYIECNNEPRNNIQSVKDFVTNNISKIGNENPIFIEMKEIFYTNLSKESIPKKVFVTGCFDMLHSGHVAFLQEAASFGDLYVSIGSDENVNSLKGRFPVNNQEERMYMIKSLKYVKECFVNSGFGIMDFIKEIEKVQPDIFIVNEDGNSPSKAELCSKMNIEYKVLKRVPHKDLPRRSTTDLRKECLIPYRIDIAGGWLDQPFVSKFYPGPVITISIEPTIEFNERSGMASSTRRKAIELWKTDIPQGNKEQLAKVLFTFDNPPGTKNVSGSQDSLGIVMPGLNKLNYKDEYWPISIEAINDEDTLSWIENSLYLITLGPRRNSFNVLDNTNITEMGAKALSDATEGCWKAIQKKDINEFGKYIKNSFEAQISMFPNMVNDEIMRIISLYRSKTKGWKLSGAGGGGYLIFVADQPLEGAIQVKVRRSTGY